MPSSTINPDQIAAQTIQYMNVFEQHVTHVPDHHNIYQCILDQGQALPPDSQWPSLDSMG